MGQGKKVEQSNVQNSFTAILTFFRKKSKDLVVIPSGGWIKITLEIEAEVKKKKKVYYFTTVQHTDVAGPILRTLWCKHCPMFSTLCCGMECMTLRYVQSGTLNLFCYLIF